jgi:two-component system sensor histidine kinase CpxA
VKSVFIKIFLWFWLAVTLIGAVGVVIALTTDPRAAALARHEKQLVRIGTQLISIYETRGSMALAEQGDRFERETGILTFLFKGDEGPLSGRFVPPRGRRLAAMTSVTGEPQHIPGKNGLWFALPMEGGYIVLAELPPPSPITRALDPRHIGLRLSVTFIVAGIVCYLLARSLTAPILQLQKAAGLFADGALSTRVGPLLGKRKDEIADLGRDFDRMAERIESLITAQQRLLGDISHELRSPLARLNVALELARQRSGAEAGDALNRIEREAERLNELIGQLLTLTLLESGSERLERIPVDLSRLVQEIAGDADFEARSRNRSIDAGVMEDITVTGSEEMLRRAIENVVRNAVHYTNEETEVHVTLQRRAVNGEPHAMLTVRDHGPGVPENELQHIFRPFYRIAAARDRRTGGTGIGLAITERAVRLHGGTVNASNAPDGGLIVEIDLPAP